MIGLRARIDITKTWKFICYYGFTVSKVF